MVIPRTIAAHPVIIGGFAGQAGIIRCADAARALLSAVPIVFAPVVAGYLRLQGSAEPDDLTSDVFLGALRNLDAFQGDEAAFRSWLFTIAHRRLLDERRRLRRRPPPEPLTDTVQYRASDDVEATVVTAAGQARVRALCDALAPDQRDVLLLRLLGGLTVEEVATALGKTPGAVKALQRRGYAGIVRRLESMGETELPSSTIGELVMAQLKQLDDVAYVRYASVYRDFKETEDFARFLGEEGLNEALAREGLEVNLPLAEGEWERGNRLSEFAYGKLGEMVRQIVDEIVTVGSPDAIAIRPLIEFVTAQELAGTAELTFSPEGLRTEVRFPL